MENWQVVLVVLASVLVGALVPVFVMLSLVLFRAGQKVARVGALLEPTLVKVQVISDRVEVLSRGLEGGEKSIAELLSVVGQLARGLERNLKLINIASRVIAAAASTAVAIVQNRRTADETEEHINES